MFQELSIFSIMTLIRNQNMSMLTWVVLERAPILAAAEVRLEASTPRPPRTHPPLSAVPPGGASSAAVLWPGDREPPVINDQSQKSTTKQNSFVH